MDLQFCYQSTLTNCMNILYASIYSQILVHVKTGIKLHIQHVVSPAPLLFCQIQFSWLQEHMHVCHEVAAEVCPPQFADENLLLRYDLSLPEFPPKDVGVVADMPLLLVVPVSHTCIT